MKLFNKYMYIHICLGIGTGMLYNIIAIDYMDNTNKTSAKSEHV